MRKINETEFRIVDAGRLYLGGKFSEYDTAFGFFHDGKLLSYSFGYGKDDSSEQTIFGVYIGGFCIFKFYVENTYKDIDVEKGLIIFNKPIVLYFPYKSL